MKKKLCVVCGVLAISWLGASGPANAVPTFFGPTPYLSASDSPFAGSSFNYFHLEDFEDDLLNTPGVTASGSWSTGIATGFADSVDADDGAIDGSGTDGRSFFSQFQNTSLTLTFNAAALGGNLPTHAGIVWTDVNAPPDSRQVVFSATDGAGLSLGSIGPFVLGDDFITGTTAEDRFFGVFNADGMSSITITMPNANNWEVDHLQYGFQSTSTLPPMPVSEPGTLALFVASLGTLLLIQRSRVGRMWTSA